MCLQRMDNFKGPLALVVLSVHILTDRYDMIG